MRVLQIQSSSRLPGGADEVMDTEAALLRGAGHDVEQLRYRPVGDVAGVRQAVDVVWNREAARQVEGMLSRFRADVVHVHSPYPLLSPVAFRVAARAGAATVTTLHNYKLVCPVGTCLRDGRICEDCVGRRLKTPGIRHRCYHDSRAASGAMAVSLLTHRLGGTFHRHVHRYLALSSYGRDVFVRDGYPADRIGVGWNSVEDPGPPISRTGPFTYAVFLGRFVPEKGIDTLLETWRELDIPLKIAGDGPDREPVERAATRNPRVEYVGWLGTAEQGHLLAGADALVFPSRWLEGQSIVMLRAMAHGIPVVSSDIPNIEETTVAHGGGVSFATRDPAALAAAVRRLAARPDEARRLGAAGRAAYLRRHTPERALARLLEHYELALATRDRGLAQR
jgi:glycosyltransferase involved in cell wall biosynthesis